MGVLNVDIDFKSDWHSINILLKTEPQKWGEILLWWGGVVYSNYIAVFRLEKLLLSGNWRYTRTGTCICVYGNMTSVITIFHRFSASIYLYILRLSPQLRKVIFGLFTVVFLCVNAEAQTHCAGNWVSHGNSCYAFITTIKSSWIDAGVRLS